MTTYDPNAAHRSALLTRAQTLQMLAAADDRRAAWIERCHGDREQVTWHRTRASLRRQRARRLADEYDQGCRPARTD